MTEVEKKVRTFCARHHLKYEWQNLHNMGQRAVVKTLDHQHRTEILNTTRRLKDFRIIDWISDEGGVFDGRIFFYDISDVVRITQAEYDAINNLYKGVWHDYFGDSPELEGRRIAMIAEYGTRLFIEGVSLEII